jgi:hypothetical protein
MEKQGEEDARGEEIESINLYSQGQSSRISGLKCVIFKMSAQALALVRKFFKSKIKLN